MKHASYPDQNLSADFSIEDLSLKPFSPQPLDKDISRMVDSLSSLLSVPPVYADIEKHKQSMPIEIGTVHDGHYAALSSVHGAGEFRDPFFPENSMAQLYLFGIGLLGTAILYKLMKQRV